MNDLAEMNDLFKEPAPRRRRWWLWLLPSLLLLGLLGGVIAVRQIENRSWDAGQAAIAAGEWETAVTEFTNIIFLWPPFLRQHTVEATALRGVAYFQQEKQLAALQDFDAALALDPNQLDIVAYRSLIHYEAEDWDLAQADTETALAQAELLPDHLLAQLNANLALLPPDLAADEVRETAVTNALALANYLPEETVQELYTRQAEITVASPEADEALAALERALTLEVGLTRAQQARLLPEQAHLLAETGRWPDALATIAEALRLRTFMDEPTQAALFDLRGQIYFAQGDWEKAVTEAEMALDLDESLAWSQAALAWQAYRQADFATAQSLSAAALAADETIGLAYTVQGALLTWQGDVHQALETLATALLYNPTDVEALALQAFNLREIHAVAELEEAVETAVAAQPNAPATIWAQAILAGEAMDEPLAFSLMNQAVALDNGRPEFYFYRALYYPQQGDSEKSLADYEASLALNPEFAPAKLGVAFFYADQYDFTYLEETQQALLETLPNWYATHIASGFYQEVAEKDYEAALAAYTQAIDLLPERPRSYLSRGYIYLERDEYDKAEADFEQTLALDEGASSAYTGLAELAEINNDVALQESYLLEAVEVSGEGREALLDLAFYYVVTAERYDDAWEIIHTLSAKDETDAAPYLLRGMIHTIEENYRQALLELDRSLDRDPYSILPYFVKAEALMLSERYEEAITTAEKIWEYDPDAYEVHQQLFFIAVNEGDFEEAERQYFRWLDAAPEDDKNYTVQASMEMNLGLFEEAIGSYAEAIARDEDDVTLLFGRAIAHLNLQDSDSAKADFARYLEVGSTIELLSDAEYWLALEEGLLVAVDGLATYTDEAAGFQISYPAEWERPLLGPEEDFVFVAFTESGGFQSINVYSVGGVFGININDIGVIVTENIRESPNIQMLNSEFGQVGGFQAFIHQYAFTRRDGLGNEEILLGQQYVVLQGSTVWFITVETDEAVFADSLPLLEEMVNSIQFLE